MFRFTIRDVLWLTVVVALAVGWWLEHRYQKAQLHTLDKEVRRLKQSPWYADVLHHLEAPEVRPAPVH